MVRVEADFPFQGPIATSPVEGPPDYENGGYSNPYFTPEPTIGAGTGATIGAGAGTAAPSPEILDIGGGWFDDQMGHYWNPATQSWQGEGPPVSQVQGPPNYAEGGYNTPYFQEPPAQAPAVNYEDTTVPSVQGPPDYENGGYQADYFTPYSSYVPTNEDLWNTGIVRPEAPAQGPRQPGVAYATPDSGNSWFWRGYYEDPGFIGNQQAEGPRFRQQAAYDLQNTPGLRAAAETYQPTGQIMSADLAKKQGGEFDYSDPYAENNPAARIIKGLVGSGKDILTGASDVITSPGTAIVKGPKAGLSQFAGGAGQIGKGALTGTIGAYEAGQFAGDTLAGLATNLSTGLTNLVDPEGVDQRGTGFSGLKDPNQAREDYIARRDALVEGIRQSGVPGAEYIAVAADVGLKMATNPLSYIGGEAGIAAKGSEAFGPAAPVVKFLAEQGTFGSQLAGNVAGAEAAQIARNELGITDEGVLGAIALGAGVIAFAATTPGGRAAIAKTIGMGDAPVANMTFRTGPYEDAAGALPPTGQRRVVQDSRTLTEIPRLEARPLPDGGFDIVDTDGNHLADIHLYKPGGDTFPYLLGINGESATIHPSVEDALQSAGFRLNMTPLQRHSAPQPLANDRLWFHSTRSNEFDLPDPDASTGGSNGITQGPGVYMAADPAKSAGHYGNRTFVNEFDGTTLDLTAPATPDTPLFEGGPTWAEYADRVAARLNEAGIRGEAGPLTGANLLYDVRSNPFMKAEMSRADNGYGMRDRIAGNAYEIIDRWDPSANKLEILGGRFAGATTDVAGTAKALINDELANSGVDAVFHHSPRADGDVLIVLNGEKARVLGDVKNAADVLRTGKTWDEIKGGVSEPTPAMAYRFGRELGNGGLAVVDNRSGMELGYVIPYSDTQWEAVAKLPGSQSRPAGVFPSKELAGEELLRRWDGDAFTRQGKFYALNSPLGQGAKNALLQPGATAAGGLYGFATGEGDFEDRLRNASKYASLAGSVAAGSKGVSRLVKGQAQGGRILSAVDDEGRVTKKPRAPGDVPYGLAAKRPGESMADFAARKKAWEESVKDGPLPFEVRPQPSTVDPEYEVLMQRDLKLAQAVLDAQEADVAAGRLAGKLEDKVLFYPPSSTDGMSKWGVEYQRPLTRQEVEIINAIRDRTIATGRVLEKDFPVLKPGDVATDVQRIALNQNWNSGRIAQLRGLTDATVQAPPSDALPKSPPPAAKPRLRMNAEGVVVDESGQALGKRDPTGTVQPLPARPTALKSGDVVQTPSGEVVPVQRPRSPVYGKTGDQVSVAEGGKTVMRQSGELTPVKPPVAQMSGKELVRELEAFAPLRDPAARQKMYAALGAEEARGGPTPIRDALAEQVTKARGAAETRTPGAPPSPTSVTRTPRAGATPESQLESQLARSVEQAKAKRAASGTTVTKRGPAPKKPPAEAIDDVARKLDEGQPVSEPEAAGAVDAVKEKVAAGEPVTPREAGAVAAATAERPGLRDRLNGAEDTALGKPVSDPNYNAPRPRTAETEAAAQKAFEEAVAAAKSRKKKAWEGIVDVMNVPRTLMTAWDLSAPLRQGAILTAGHPIAGAKAFRDMIHALGSDDFAKAVTDSLDDGSPLSQLRRNSELYLASYGKEFDINRAEEAFMTKWAGRVPGVKASNRAYATYLDKLRADVFDHYIESWGGPEKVDLRDAHDLAKFINHATGRGTGKVLDAAGPTLNAFFFAPRLMVSRVQTPLDLFTSTRAVRWEVARSLAAFATAGGTALTLGSILGGEVNGDINKADWGKLKFGNTRYDFWAGNQQIARALYRFIDTRDPAEAGQIAFNFFRGKLNPATGTLVDLKYGKNIVNEDTSVTKGGRRGNVLLKNVIPLFAQDLWDAYDEWGAKGLLYAAPAGLGVGVMTYEPEKDKRAEFEQEWRAQMGISPDAPFTAKQKQDFNAAAAEKLGARDPYKITIHPDLTYEYKQLLTKMGIDPETATKEQRDAAKEEIQKRPIGWIEGTTTDALKKLFGTKDVFALGPDQKAPVEPEDPSIARWKQSQGISAPSTPSPTNKDAKVIGTPTPNRRMSTPDVYAANLNKDYGALQGYDASGKFPSGAATTPAETAKVQVAALPKLGGSGSSGWRGAAITQGFGPTDEPLDGPYGGYDHFNKGYDFAVPEGTSIDATVGGEVLSAGDSGDGWGISVKIRDSQGNIHNYGHLSVTDLKPGMKVTAGTVVGLSGNTGASTGAHLSYDVLDSSGKYIDPVAFLDNGGKVKTVAAPKSSTAVTKTPKAPKAPAAPKEPAAPKATPAPKVATPKPVNYADTIVKTPKATPELPSNVTNIQPYMGATSAPRSTPSIAAEKLIPFVNPNPNYYVPPATTKIVKKASAATNRAGDDSRGAPKPLPGPKPTPTPKPPKPTPAPGDGLTPEQKAYLKEVARLRAQRAATRPSRVRY